jgi:transcriptional regulator with XRE-family HTH domain
MHLTRINTKPQAALQIGQLIKELRKKQRMTGEQLAQKVGMSQSRVSKIENGYSASVMPSQIELILNILNTSKTIRQQIAILLLERSAGSAMQFSYPFHYPQDFSAIDQQTTVARCYIVCAPSAILQTPEYHEAYARKLGISEQEIASEVSKNIQRQDLLWDRSKSFYFIMPEAALYTMPADTAVQLAQLDRLERLIGYKHISIGIVPLHMGMLFFETSSFSIQDDALVLVYMGDRTVKVQEQETIVKYMNAFAELDQKAVYGDEALQLVRKAADYSKGQSFSATN